MPSNVGPRTMPSYEALAAQGVYELGNGIRVFAGQRDDPFYIDLGAVFDTLNLRSPGVDMLSGFNVHTIALEIPISLRDGRRQGSGDDGLPEDRRLREHAAAAGVRRSARTEERSEGAGAAPRQPARERGRSSARSTRIAGTAPSRRTRPSSSTTTGTRASQPRSTSCSARRFRATPRDDLRDLLLKYDPSDTRLSELLRLDVSVDPTPLGAQQRLTVLAGDPAGWPNGRRPIDDVTDVAVQVVGGPAFAGAGDAVNANDRAQVGVFPFLATPHDGRGRFHANP